MYELNEQQKKAAYLSNNNVLIVAGAGSGKTSVICHRIEYLIHEKKLSISNMLVITFTVKAANELLERISQLTHFEKRYTWIGTFHGLANRLLRIHHNLLNLDRDFIIINDKEQLKTIKNIITDPQYNLLTSALKSCDWSLSNLQFSDIEDKAARTLQKFINNCKDVGIRSSDVILDNRLTELQQHFYAIYEAKLSSLHALDFGDLLLYAYELWQKHPAILKVYQEKFQHIMIDEFQDINTIQYKWLLALHNDHNHIMAVGDDDQAIYSFRGSKSEYMKLFLTDVKNVQLIKLTQNYRSTQNILDVANSVISHNKERLTKQLWSDKQEGEKILVIDVSDPLKEAFFIARKILSIYKESGDTLDNIAILYRLNSLSRLIEQALSNFSIKYRIRGGVEFYQREEIKHALAYVHLIINKNNNDAFRRIVNTPARGIGKKTLSSLENLGYESLWQATEIAIKQSLFSKKATSSLQNFVNLMNEITSYSCSLHLDELFKMIIEKTGLELLYSESKNEESRQKRENLAELVRAASQFIPSTEDKIREFLDSTKLEAYDDKSNKEPAVNLMTIHSSKGLEFKHVFIIGMEEGILPIIENVEEERRLCYVAITRAKSSLVLTWCRFRNNDREPIRQSSRFLSEIPREYVLQFSI